MKKIFTFLIGLSLWTLTATAGHPVMRSAYCIRREIGQCLKEHPTLKGELFLVRGRFRYRLRFDCARCEMSLIDESDRK